MYKLNLQLCLYSLSRPSKNLYSFNTLIESPNCLSYIHFATSRGQFLNLTKYRRRVLPLRNTLSSCLRIFLGWRTSSCSSNAGGSSLIGSESGSSLYGLRRLTWKVLWICHEDDNFNLYEVSFILSKIWNGPQYLFANLAQNF